MCLNRPIPIFFPPQNCDLCYARRRKPPSERRRQKRQESNGPHSNLRSLALVPLIQSHFIRLLSAWGLIVAKRQTRKSWETDMEMRHWRQKGGWMENERKNSSHNGPPPPPSSSLEVFTCPTIPRMYLQYKLQCGSGTTIVVVIATPGRREGEVENGKDVLIKREKKVRGEQKGVRVLPFQWR